VVDKHSACRAPTASTEDLKYSAVRACTCGHVKFCGGLLLPEAVGCAFPSYSHMAALPAQLCCLCIDTSQVRMQSTNQSANHYIKIPEGCCIYARSSYDCRQLSAGVQPQLRHQQVVMGCGPNQDNYA
jgi:hypothetical protein